MTSHIMFLYIVVTRLLVLCVCLYGSVHGNVVDTAISVSLLVLCVGLYGGVRGNVVDSAINDTCQNQGYMYDQSTRLCLKFILDVKNWTDAQADCGKQDGRLVVVTSNAKTHDLEHYLAAQTKYKNVKFWVGATEVSHVHTFTWTDGKTIVVDDYSKYDLTKANCLLTANPKPPNAYQPCRELNSYICENSNYIRAK